MAQCRNTDSHPPHRYFEPGSTVGGRPWMQQCPGVSEPCWWDAAHEPHMVGYHVVRQCPGRTEDAQWIKDRKARLAAATQPTEAALTDDEQRWLTVALHDHAVRQISFTRYARGVEAAVERILAARTAASL